MKKAVAMLERRSLAIEPARAAWHDWLAVAQRVRQLTQDGAGACEGLIESLQRWPSFAAADPWAFNAQMPAGPETASGPSLTKRSRSVRDALPPAAAARATPGRPAALVAQSDLQPGMLSPRAPATRPVSALTPRTPAAAADAETLGINTDAQAPRGSDHSIPTAASVIAALVAETMARHAPNSPAAASASRAWSDLLPVHAELAPAVERATSPGQVVPNPSRAPLQAVDLPVREALDRIAQTEAPKPAAALLAPAAELLQRLLTDATAASATHQSVATTAARAAAPRAPSRLLTDPGRSTSTPAIGPRSGAPDSALPEVDSETSAEAISRLLADQAWLRGVDFT